MTEPAPPNPDRDVTYLGEVVEKIQMRLRTVADVAMTRVLPGARGKLIIPLNEVDALLKSVAEVLERSGMDVRLGFVRVEKGIEPVILKEKPEEKSDA